LQPIDPVISGGRAFTYAASAAVPFYGSATASKICGQIPRALHRLKRLYTAVWEPYSGGQSVQVTILATRRSKRLVFLNRFAGGARPKMCLGTVPMQHAGSRCARKGL
jgi:hypothetical protein